MRVNMDFLKSFDEREKVFLEKVMPEIHCEYDDYKAAILSHYPSGLFFRVDTYNSVEENTEEALLLLIRKIIFMNDFWEKAGREDIIQDTVDLAMKNSLANQQKYEALEKKKTYKFIKFINKILRRKE